MDPGLTGRVTVLQKGVLRNTELNTPQSPSCLMVLICSGMCVAILIPERTASSILVNSTPEWHRDLSSEDSPLKTSADGEHLSVNDFVGTSWWGWGPRG